MLKISSKNITTFWRYRNYSRFFIEKPYKQATSISREGNIFKKFYFYLFLVSYRSTSDNYFRRIGNSHGHHLPDSLRQWLLIEIALTKTTNSEYVSSKRDQFLSKEALKQQLALKS